MKKRIITLLAILALLVTCVVFAVQADETDTSTETTTKFMDQLCPCGSGKTLRQETWHTWGVDENYSWTASDHILLTGGTFGSAQNLNNQAKTVILVRKGLDDDDTGKVTVGPSGAVQWFTNLTKEVIFIGENAVLTSQLTTSNGGLMRINDNGKLTIKGGITLQGRSGASKATSGGLIAVMPGGQCTLDGVTLVPASCTQGGAVFVNSGTLNMTNCQITGDGTATVGSGGAIALDIYSNDTVANLTNVTITGCSATGTGGAICFTKGTVSGKTKTLTLDGCTISDCTAGTSGGAMYIIAGTANVKDTTITADADCTGDERGIMINGAEAKCNLYGDTVINSANVGLGDGVYLYTGTLTLSGGAIVQNAAGTKVNNIARSNDSEADNVIQVARDWTGSASLYTGVDITKHGGTYCTAFLNNGTIDQENGFAFTKATGTSTKALKLYIENTDHENPGVHCYGGNFVIRRVNLYENGVATEWYLRPIDAFTAYKNSTATEKYIKLWIDFATTNSIDELYVDFNGCSGATWTNNAGKTLYAFDSTAEVGGAGITLTPAGDGKVSPVTNINGKSYVVVDNVIYPVEVKISKASLRLATAGIYYTAELNCAEEAKASLTYGVAVQLGKEVTDLTKAAYTAVAGDTENANSMIVNSILYTVDEANTVVAGAKARANETIFAKAYVAVGTDVTNVDVENIILSDAQNLSLTSMMGKVDEKVAADGFDDSVLTSIKAFYDKFATAAEWTWSNIAAIGQTEA